VADRVDRLCRAAGLDGAVVVVVDGARGQPQGDALLSVPAPGADGVVLHHRADLFAQANAAGNVLLVAEAMRALGPAGASAGGRLLELYAGNGNFTFAAVRQGWVATTVESSLDPVELARRSAREAQVTGVRFIQGDAPRVAEAVAREGQAFDALLLDPPRAGARGIGAVAARSGARRVVYVSCDPATLARDVGELRAAGFLPTEATPVDMFPQTFHLEAVVVLVREG
jgi:23S rRNA (uracil1939-C5)-methyltransferase